MLKSIDSSIIEIKTPPLECVLYISTIDEVVAQYGTSKYYISDKYLETLYENGKHEFPLSEFQRQIVSMCLQGTRIALCGFDKNIIVNISKTISILGGKIVIYDPTIVISKTAVSNKVFDARKKGIPVITLHWLYECLTSLSYVPYEKFIMLPLSQCVFTSSDLTPDQQDKLKKIIKHYGGEWSSDFKVDEVTFVISSSLTSTKKISLALANSVPIVHPNWFEDPYSSPFEHTLNWWCFSNDTEDLFQNCIFSIARKCENISALHDCIVANGGSIGSKPTHLIVPLNYRSKKDLAGHILVTPEWIWKCAELKTIIDIQTPLCSPLPFSIPIEGFKNCVFALMNMEDDNRIMLANIIRAFGGMVTYKISKSSTIILSSKYLEGNNIPIVNPQFVLQALKSGLFPNIELYYVKEKQVDTQLNEICHFLHHQKSIIHGDYPSEIVQRDLENFTQDIITSPNPEMHIDVVYESNESNNRYSKEETQDPILRLFPVDSEN